MELLKCDCQAEVRWSHRISKVCSLMSLLEVDMFSSQYMDLHSLLPMYVLHVSCKPIKRSSFDFLYTGLLYINILSLLCTFHVVYHYLEIWRICMWYCTYLEYATLDRTYNVTRTFYKFKSLNKKLH